MTMLHCLKRGIDESHDMVFQNLVYPIVKIPVKQFREGREEP